MDCALHSCISVVAFLCLAHYVNLVTISPETGEQWTYLYNANTSVASNVSGDVASQWSLSAKLIIQSYKSYKIMKLDDIKTSAYNGRTDQNPNFEIESPEGTAILSEPFLVHYNNNYDKLESLSFSSKDSEWSKNIKKAIASIYQVDFNNILQSNDSNISSEEQSIHGKCKIKYEYLSTDDGSKFMKEINNKDCIIENSSRNIWGNISLGYFDGRTVRYYTYNQIILESDNVPAKNIKSKTSFLYWVMKSDRTMHKIDQT